MTTASAPSKLILFGEYAVLFGHPSLVLAVDRRVSVRFERGSQGIFSSPQALSARWTMEQGKPRWTDGERPALLDAVLHHVSATGELESDSSSCYASNGSKLGLGSSAAVCTAMVAALTNRTDVFDLAFSAHRQFQHGKGSGADIAASCRGGLVEYRMTPRAIRAVSWPAGMHFRCISTGCSASTPRFLEALQTHQSAARPIVDEMGHIAVDAMQSGRWNELARQAFSLMDTLGRAIGMPIVSPQHRELAQIAAKVRLGYKPSGAGGGDMGIVFGEDVDRLIRFSDAAVAAGYQSVPLSIDPQGVRLESHPQP